MRNPFTRLVNKISQKLGYKMKAKSIEPIERLKDKQRSSVGGGSAISAKNVSQVSVIEKQKEVDAIIDSDDSKFRRFTRGGKFVAKYYFIKRKKARKQARLSRRINRLAMQ